MKLKQTILISLIIGVTILTVNFSTDKRDLSGDFTANEIRNVKLGMTLEEVEEILGRPFQIKALVGLHDLTCKRPKHRLLEDISLNSPIRDIVNQKFSETDYCCVGNKEDLEKKRVTLVYTHTVEFSKNYPMLWIHLNSSFRVASVFAKQYDGYLGFDDPCIYSLNAARDFEDKELFEKNFR